MNPELAERELLIRRELAWRDVLRAGPNSFELFCTFLLITTWTPGEKIRFTWNVIQRALNEARTGRDIVLKSRQVGMTTFELARDLWYAVVHAGSSVAVMTQPHKTAEPTKRVVRTLRAMTDALEELRPELRPHWSGNSVTFANGSVVAVMDAGGSELAADKQGRGGTYHRVHFTELAFYPFATSVMDAILNAVPKPHQGGEVTIESTPNGATGKFYDVWKGAEAKANGFRGHFFGWFWDAKNRLHVPEGQAVPPATARDEIEEQIVREAGKVGRPIDQAQLDWWREHVALAGLNRTLQEYPNDPETCFLRSGASYFDLDAIARIERQDLCEHFALPELIAASKRAHAAQDFRLALTKVAERLNRGTDWRDADTTPLRVWALPKHGHSYRLVCDTASGVGKGDWLVCNIYDDTPGTDDRRAHVATYRTRTTPPAAFARNVHALALAYGEGQVAVERNAGGHGNTVIHVLENELKYPRLWRDENSRIGWETTRANRMRIIDDLVDAVTAGEYFTRDAKFTQEARDFIRHPDGKVAAAPGCYDDTIMCAAIAWAVMIGPRGPERGPRRSDDPQAEKLRKTPIGEEDPW